MKRIRKAVIPAAGYGTRFLPLTKVVPKELLPIGNKPAIQYVVEEAVAAGIEEIIIVCHPSKTAVADYFKPDRELRTFLEKKGKKEEIATLDRVEGMALIQVVYQEEPLGLGHAVLCAREAVGDEPFVVMLPDVIIPSNQWATAGLLQTCQAEGKWGVLLERVPSHRVSNYGIARCREIASGEYTLEGAVEKPSPGEAPSDLAILGRYLLLPEIFNDLSMLGAGSLGEIQLTDGINALARKKLGKGVLFRGDVFDVGTPEGLCEAYQYFESIASLPLKKARNMSC